MEAKPYEANIVTRPETIRDNAQANDVEKFLEGTIIFIITANSNEPLARKCPIIMTKFHPNPNNTVLIRRGSSSDPSPASPHGISQPNSKTPAINPAFLIPSVSLISLSATTFA
jgi:hypothetical protein